MGVCYLRWSPTDRGYLVLVVSVIRQTAVNMVTVRLEYAVNKITVRQEYAVLMVTARWDYAVKMVMFRQGSWVCCGHSQQVVCCSSRFQSYDGLL